MAAGIKWTYLRIGTLITLIWQIGHFRGNSSGVLFHNYKRIRIHIRFLTLAQGDLAQAKSGAPKRASSGSCRQGTEGLGCGKTTRLRKASVRGGPVHEHGW